MDFQTLFAISSVKWKACGAQNHRKFMISIHFHDLFNGVGSVGNPESLTMQRFPYIFHYFFGGVGSVGSPESLNMHKFPFFLCDFCGGVGSVGNPKSLKRIGFHTFFMISLVEWAAWEAIIIKNV